MTHHYLSVAVQVSLADASIDLRVDFQDGLESRISEIMPQTSALPATWDSTVYTTDAKHLGWKERGSRAALSAVLLGCSRHGWPFVPYVVARADASPSTWLADFDPCCLGWWPSRQAFAQEIAESAGQFTTVDEELDQQTIDEICGGFLCIDVDGQVLAFDLMPAR